MQLRYNTKNILITSILMMLLLIPMYVFGEYVLQLTLRIFISMSILLILVMIIGDIAWNKKHNIDKFVDVCIIIYISIIFIGFLGSMFYRLN